MLKPGDKPLAGLEVRLWLEKQLNAAFVNRVRAAPLRDGPEIHIRYCTTTIVFGGSGRSVIGRFVLEDGPDDERNIEYGTVRIMRLLPEFLKPNMILESYRANEVLGCLADKEGRFRIDDVPPGDWTLKATLYGPPDAKIPDSENVRGECETKFTVHPPDDGAKRTDEPHDFGTLKIRNEKNTKSPKRP